MPRDSESVFGSTISLQTYSFSALTATAFGYTSSTYQYPKTYQAGSTNGAPWPPYQPIEKQPVEERFQEYAPADKTDEPVKITIAPAKLRYKRRIE
jgi:hypothetical protein